MKKISALFYQKLVNSAAGRWLLNRTFKSKYNNSTQYWEERYRKAGNSGVGSYGENALYKAEVLNQFIAENKITKVIEWGCGDSNQLTFFNFDSYVGVDVSATAIKKCIENFKSDTTKNFFVSDTVSNKKMSDNYGADLALSLDVIYHLVEDNIFETYMNDLFYSADRFVIIYAWDVAGIKKFHVRHRNFSSWINNNLKNWKLYKRIEKSGGQCDFFIYEKIKTAELPSL